MSISGALPRRTVHHDNAALPELLRVFKRAKHHTLNSERHALFNSWLIAGIMHRSNPNAHAILDRHPDTNHTIHYCLQLLGREANGQPAHRCLSIDQRQSLIADQKDIIDHIYSYTNFDTPLALRSLTLAAHIFNRRDTVTESIKALAEGDGQEEKRKRFIYGVSPFVTLHITTHLMHIIGQQLEDSGATDSKVNRFKNFLTIARHESLPLQSHSHEITETVTLRAVELLRGINSFLGTVHANGLGGFLPDDAIAENSLVAALLIHTNAYRPQAPISRSITPASTDNVLAFQPG